MEDKEAAQMYKATLRVVEEDLVELVSQLMNGKIEGNGLIAYLVAKVRAKATIALRRGGQ